MLRFTTRALLWLMVVVGLVLMLLPQIQRRREAERMVGAMTRSKASPNLPTRADYDSLPYGQAKPNQ